MVKPKEKKMKPKLNIENDIVEADFNPDTLPDGHIAENMKNAEEQLKNLAKILYNNFLFAGDTTRIMDIEMLRKMVGDVNYSMYLLVVMSLGRMRDMRAKLEQYEQDKNATMYS